MRRAKAAILPESGGRQGASGSRNVHAGAMHRPSVRNLRRARPVERAGRTRCGCDRHAIIAECGPLAQLVRAEDLTETP